MKEVKSCVNLKHFAALLGAFDCRDMKITLREMPKDFEYLRKLCCLRNYFLLNRENNDFSNANPWDLSITHSRVSLISDGGYKRIKNHRPNEFIQKISMIAHTISLIENEDAVKAATEICKVCSGPAPVEVPRSIKKQDDLNVWLSKWFYKHLLEILNSSIQKELDQLIENPVKAAKFYNYLGTTKVNVKKLWDMSSIWAQPTDKDFAKNKVEDTEIVEVKAKVRREGEPLVPIVPKSERKPEVDDGYRVIRRTTSTKNLEDLGIFDEEIKVKKSKKNMEECEVEHTVASPVPRRKISKQDLYEDNIMLTSPEKKTLPYGIYIEHISRICTTYGLMFSSENVFWKLICMSDCYKGSDSIYDFAIEPISKFAKEKDIQVFVDSDNAHFLTMLSGIEYLAKLPEVTKINIYIDKDTMPLWKIVDYSKYDCVMNKISIVKVDRIIEGKSLVDARIMSDIMSADPDVVKVIVSSDSDYITIANTNNLVVTYTVDRFGISDKYLQQLQAGGIKALPFWQSNSVLLSEQSCKRLLAYEALYKKITMMSMSAQAYDKADAVKKIHDKLRQFHRDRIYFREADKKLLTQEEIWAEAEQLIQGRF